MPRVAAVSVNLSPTQDGEKASEVIIASGGDVCLQIEDPKTKSEHRYRCSIAVLTGNSEYFRVLLDPGKFSEGRATEARLQEMYKLYKNTAFIPTSELPTIQVSDVGELPEAGVSAKAIVQLFLGILHDPSTTWPFPKSQGINVIALLAIVADRLAATEAVQDYLLALGLNLILLKERKSATPHQREIDNRQRLLAGLTFGFESWVRHSSAALVIDGPKRVSATNIELSDEEDQDNGAFWFRLPNGIEEELACRRDYVLDALSSIQKHFVNLYIKKANCKLGYGSSPACDAFQLGEMIRFLTRKGTMTLESSISLALNEPEPYNGSLNDIITRLRECPSYQIDEYHAHCGLRTRLIPILNSLDLNQAAICHRCWVGDRSKESWLETPNLGTWEFRKSWVRDAANGPVMRGCEDHRRAKAMFTADKRDWTPVVTS